MGNDNEHKKHHYVPQCYLNQFGHSNGKEKHEKYFLYVFNKNIQKSYYNAVDNICRLDYFYKISDEYLKNCSASELNELSIEVDYFDKNVESNLGKILIELEERKNDCVKHKLQTFPMLFNDKFLIAQQIVIQFLRLPKMRLWDNNFNDELIPKMIRLMQYGLAIEMNNPEIAKLDIKYDYDRVVSHAKHSFMNYELINKFASDMATNLWTFLYSPQNDFCTSDNPVVCLQDYPNERPLNCGLNQKGVKIFYALSPSLLLLIMDKNESSGIDCKFGFVSDFCLDLFNKGLYSQSEYIFNYNNNFDFFIINNNG